MKININGLECEAKYGEYILEVATRNNIYIPTLCHDDALPGQACCRICIVEVVEQSRSQVVTSCVYPITKEITVITDSTKLQDMRKTLIMLLAARTPENKIIKKWAEEYQVQQTIGFASDPNEHCILCNRCVNACNKLGTSAIATVNRGTTKKVATPFEEASLSCIGCKACATICPTGAIKVFEEDGKRVIWNTEFTLIPCSICGENFATKEQLAYLNKKLNAPLVSYNGNHICDKCRTKNQVRQLNLSAFQKA